MSDERQGVKSPPRGLYFAPSMNNPALPNPFPASFRRIGLATPARPAAPERLALGRRQLAEWGLEGVEAVVSEPPARYFSTTDAVRTRAFNALLHTDGLDAIWAIRGGYGSARILELLDWEAWRRKPLPLIGYSDVSALHLAAFSQCIRTGLAGPMLAVEFGQVPASPEAAAALAFTTRSFAEAWQPRDAVSPAARRPPERAQAGRGRRARGARQSGLAGLASGYAVDARSHRLHPGGRRHQRGGLPH